MGRMLAVTMVTIDCDDPQALAEFWAQALHREISADWGDFVVLAGTPAIGLQRVESIMPGKNRLHLDLSGGDRAPEVARLVELGADVVRTHDVEGFGWTVMTDPAGNEFCVSDPHDGGEEAEPRTEEDGDRDFDGAPDITDEDERDDSGDLQRDGFEERREAGGQGQDPHSDEDDAGEGGDRDVEREGDDRDNAVGRAEDDR